MPVDPHVATDIAHLLDATCATGTLHDELVLLRASLRRYVEVGNAPEAVAWAAAELSASISRTSTPDR